ELAERQVEGGANTRREALEEPDVCDRRGQVDVPCPLAADLRVDDFDAALLADDTAVLHPLVLAAQALVVLDGPEDLGAKESVTLRLEGPVVDGLGVLDLPVALVPDDLGRSEADAEGIEDRRLFGLFEEAENVAHVRFPLLSSG